MQPEPNELKKNNESIDYKNSELEARQNIAGFFGLSLKLNAKVKISFSIRQRKKQAKYDFLWKLAKLLLLILQIVSLFIK